MAQLNPYLGLNGNCKEVMTFYKECIGGELILQTMATAPSEFHIPSTKNEQILHSELKKDEFVLYATDMNGPEGYAKGNNISLCVNCKSEEEINTFFNNLSNGGKVLDPLKEMFWGDIFGSVVDKYGIYWMFNCSKDSKIS